MERTKASDIPSRPIPPAERGLGFLLYPFYFILLLWLVYWLDSRQMLHLYELGILPRHPSGLIGVITAPLIHGSLGHLSNNSIPLLVLGAGIYYFYPRIANRVILAAWLGSGLLVWVIGRENYHIGASGLIYALAAFIFLSGLLRRQPNLLALSLLVVFLYGSLVWGVFPLRDGVSWEAHLAGGLSGLLLAIRYRQEGPRSRRYSWDEEEEEDDDDLPPEEPIEPEAWEEYSRSRHGIHYHYNPRKDENDGPV